MTATDMWRIADEELHGAGYKTLVCCPENVLTGAPAQFECLIAVPFPHILRRAFVFFSGSSNPADPAQLQKAVVGGTFTAIGFVTLPSGSNVNFAEFDSAVAGVEMASEEATDTFGALYRGQLDLTIGGDTVTNFGIALMVTPIPSGGYQHAQ